MLSQGELQSLNPVGALIGRWVSRRQNGAQCSSFNGTAKARGWKGYSTQPTHASDVTGSQGKAQQGIQGHTVPQVSAKDVQGQRCACTWDKWDLKMKTHRVLSVYAENEAWV